MLYKKGSIIPRSIVRCKNRKTQYLWKFGADVEVLNKEITILDDGTAIVSNHSFIGGIKGKPRIYNIALLEDVSVNVEKQGLDTCGFEFRA